jgi:DNA-binding GntR family transcriptional regulator
MCVTLLVCQGIYQAHASVARGPLRRNYAQRLRRSPSIDQAGGTSSTCAERENILSAVPRGDPADAADAMSAHMDAASGRRYDSLRDS